MTKEIGRGNDQVWLNNNGCGLTRGSNDTVLHLTTVSKSHQLADRPSQ